MAVTPQRMNKYYKAYETMRRKRHGFHNPKNDLVDELKEKYRTQFEAEEDRKLSVEQRYKKYLKHVDIVNAEIDDDFMQMKLREHIQANQFLPFTRTNKITAHIIQKEAHQKHRKPERPSLQFLR